MYQKKKKFFVKMVIGMLVAASLLVAGCGEDERASSRDRSSSRQERRARIEASEKAPAADIAEAAAEDTEAVEAAAVEEAAPEATEDLAATTVDAMELYEAFLHNEIASHGEWDGVDLNTMVCNGLNEYDIACSDMDVDNEYDTGEKTADDVLNVQYVILETITQPVLFIDVSVAGMSASHSLYQFSCKQGELVLESVLDLAWCDNATYYKQGYVSIEHGQHMLYTNEVFAATKPMREIWDEDSTVQLFIAGPSDWVDDDYSDKADKVIIFDDYDEWEDLMKQEMNIDVYNDTVVPQRVSLDMIQ